MKKWTDEQLRATVPNCKNIAAVIRSLGLVRTGAVYHSIQKRMRFLNLDTSHFRPLVMKGRIDFLPLEEVLCLGSKVDPGTVLRAVKRERVVDLRCEMCGITDTYNNKPIVLQLDHKNGCRSDNRVENLRFLCPNCHTQTPTWGHKIRS